MLTDTVLLRIYPISDPIAPTEESLPATPNTGEQITIGGRTYRIMSVCKDIGRETYTLHLEKA
jgi:hypothetical protein